jgi:hypothetical protein
MLDLKILFDRGGEGKTQMTSPLILSINKQFYLKEYDTFYYS